MNKENKQEYKKKKNTLCGQDLLSSHYAYYYEKLKDFSTGTNITTEALAAGLALNNEIVIDPSHVPKEPEQYWTDTYSRDVKRLLDGLVKGTMISKVMAESVTKKIYYNRVKALDHYSVFNALFERNMDVPEETLIKLMKLTRAIAIEGFIINAEVNRQVLDIINKSSHEKFKLSLTSESVKLINDLIRDIFSIGKSVIDLKKFYASDLRGAASKYVTDSLFDGVARGDIVKPLIKCLELNACTTEPSIVSVVESKFNDLYL